MDLVIRWLTLQLVIDFCISDWSYNSSDKYGPDKWHEQYSGCGEGQLQSPVDIGTDMVWYDSKLTALELVGFESIPRGTHWELCNLGHAVQLQLDGGYRVMEGGLVGVYKAVSLVFHWGSADTHGSEHSIDGQTYSLEMQILLFNVMFGSVDEAYGHKGGIAILAFLVRAVETDNPTFKQIVNNLGNISHKGDHVSLRPIPLLSILPFNLNNYYRYEGSLTHPPCTEPVLWTVFTEPAEMSKAQLKKFRTQLQSTAAIKGQPPDLVTPLLVNNFRPMQPINGRTVYSSNPDDATLWTAPLGSPISITLAMLMGFLIIFVFVSKRFPHQDHEQCDGQHED